MQSALRLVAIRLALASSLSALLASGAAHAGVIFSFTGSTGNASADSAFDLAALRWSSRLQDNITINIARGYSNLSQGTLAQADSSRGFSLYSDISAALTADRTSQADYRAVASLPALSVPLLLNRVSDRPSGTALITPFLDNNNSNNNRFLNLTSANAKALGLLAPHDTGLDASITFSSAFTWDFNPNDGITAGAYDFVGAATHEIGHALGFISGVDVLDNNSTTTIYSSDSLPFVSPLDLFRYSTTSALNGAIDFTADTRAKFFSIDGGATSLGGFSTGVNYGDGRQASHLKDNLGLGIMDPTAAPGELLSITALDVMALDVIGYNVFFTVDEPGSVALCALILMAAVAVRRRSLAPAAPAHRH